MDTNSSIDVQDQLCNSFKKMKNIHESGGIIVTFDVGGQIYRISKELLEQYPNTMLFIAASDIETSNEDDPIFIERNGNRFQYVLDCMRDDTIDFLDSLSTSNRKTFFQDMEYYGFRCDHDTYFPKDVMYMDGVKYHQIVWDVSVASAGLIFECKNHIIKVDTFKLEPPSVPVLPSRLPPSVPVLPSRIQQRLQSLQPMNLNIVSQPSFQSWQSVMGTVGYRTGVHFWNFEIVEDDSNRHIMIGVSYNQLLVTKSSSFLGGCSEVGDVGYHGETGNLHFGTSHTSTRGANGIVFGPTFGKGDVIGTLLNMNRKTVTFYKNGVRVGTAANADCILGHKEYYSCVSLSSPHQKIRTISHNEIFT